MIKTEMIDEFGNGNRIILVEGFCPNCKTYSKFINVAQIDEEFICLNCNLKTDFENNELKWDKFGCYWKKRIKYVVLNREFKSLEEAEEYKKTNKIEAEILKKYSQTSK